MQNFVVHSNESACIKSGRLGLEQVVRLLIIYLLVMVGNHVIVVIKEVIFIIMPLLV